MRTFKFRGKNTLSGKWVYGTGIQRYTKGNVYITNESPFGYDVVPETVGQFTGLVDKNGKEVYEGDIIKIVEKFDDENVYTSNGVVCFEEGIYELQNGKHFAYLGWLMHNDDITKLEVIGNIHDNPELLEKGGNQ